MAKNLFFDDLIITANKLTWHEKLGEGAFGEVFRVTHEDWGQLAVKKLGVQTMVHE